MNMKKEKKLWGRLDCGRGMRIRGMGIVNPWTVNGMTYPPNGNEIPIPYNKFANPNTNTWA